MMCFNIAIFLKTLHKEETAMLIPRSFRKVKALPAALIAFSMLMFLYTVPFSASAVDYYVKTPAHGGNNASSGLSWDTAKATIGGAMNLVGGAANIHVAAGTYNEKITFPGFDNVSLLGGYPASGGASQDPAGNPTIIDGVNLPTTAAMISIPIKQNGTNGYSGIVVDGFTIRNGTRTGMGSAGIESYSLGVTITRNTIENNRVTGTDGVAGGIYIFGPLNDNNTGRTIIEQNVIRNNAAAAVGGIYLEGAGDKTKRYAVYLVNNLIYGNQSTTDNAGWSRGVGGIDIMYPASASIVNCTIVDNAASHPDPAKAVGGVSISGYPGQNGIAAIANSIIRHENGKDILPAADGTGTLWIAYSNVKDTGISGTGVIHTDPQFAGAADYHIGAGSPCKNTGNSVGTVLTGTKTTMYDIGYKSGSYNYSDAQVTWNWGDGIHDLKAQWQYNAALSTSYGHPVGKFFGTSNANCTADPADQQAVSNMSAIDVSAYAFANGYKTGEYNYPWLAKQTIFWKGTNGYYGAWRIDGIAATYVNPNYYGRLNVTWYFQINGSPYFDAGIRTQDLEGKARPAEAGYDMGAYEYAPDATPPAGSISINNGASCTQSVDVILNLSASDPSGVAQMQFSNDNVQWSSPETYAAAKSWTLTAGTGTKTVYVKFKDSLENWSNPYSATIALPAAGDVNIDGRVDLADALTALKVTAGIPLVMPPGILCSGVSDKHKIGLEETIYILQTVSGLR